MHDCWHDEYGQGSRCRSIGQVSQSFPRKKVWVQVSVALCAWLLTGMCHRRRTWGTCSVMLEHSTNQPLAALDGSQVEDMNNMFEEAIVYRVPRAFYQPIGPCTCICTCCCLKMYIYICVCICI